MHIENVGNTTVFGKANLEFANSHLGGFKSIDMCEASFMWEPTSHQEAVRFKN